MKTLTSFILILFSTVAFAQSDITSQVSSALKNGDAAALSSYMMPTIELTLNGEDNNLEKAEVQRILAGFFKDHTVTAFVIKHQGTSKLDDQYRIGDLNTSKGIFRVTFFMKKTATAMQIKQLKIEPAE